MRKYSDEVKDFIEENVKGRTTKDLMELVNAKFGTDFTESKMKVYKTNNKLKSGTPLGLPAGRATDLYSEEIIQFIAENHAGIGPREMTNLLNETFGTNYTNTQLKAYYGNRKLDSGLKGYFSKGHVPANKGVKGMGGWEPTQFKEGHRPANWVPIGSERVNGDGYVDVKVLDGQKQKNWKGKHICIWEDHHGPVPEGYAVIFGDGDRRNFDVDNLIAVSKGQLATLNRKGLIQKDADLTRTAIAVVDIIQKISERKVK